MKNFKCKIQVIFLIFILVKHDIKITGIVKDFSIAILIDPSLS